jgi:hypothetical protein
MAESTLVLSLTLTFVIMGAVGIFLLFQRRETGVGKTGNQGRRAL